MRLTRWRYPVLACAVTIVCAVAGPRALADDDGRFEIRNAYVELADDKWYLDVRLELGLSTAARQAFGEGVPLTLRLDAEATVARRFLPDKAVVSRSWEWKLAYDAIADRYVVHAPADGGQASHASRDEALAALARIGALPIADTSMLPPDGRFDMRVRASVEIGELPAAVKVLLFWRSWSRDTDWYVWSVRP